MWLSNYDFSCKFIFIIIFLIIWYVLAYYLASLFCHHPRKSLYQVQESEYVAIFFSCLLIIETIFSPSFLSMNLFKLHVQFQDQFSQDHSDMFGKFITVFESLQEYNSYLEFELKLQTEPTIIDAIFLTPTICLIYFILFKSKLNPMQQELFTVLQMRKQNLQINH